MNKPVNGQLFLFSVMGCQCLSFAMDLTLGALAIHPIFRCLRMTSALHFTSSVATSELHN